MGARGPIPKAKGEVSNAGYRRGRPKMPDGLSPAAQEVWAYVVRQIPPNRSSPADKFSLLGLSRWFVQWDRLMTSLESEPADARLQRQAVNAWTMVDQQLRQLGLTIVARARMPGGGAKQPKEAENPLLKIHAMREGKRRRPG